MASAAMKLVERASFRPGLPPAGGRADLERSECQHDCGSKKIVVR